MNERDPLIEAIRRAGDAPPPPDREGALRLAMAAIPSGRRAKPLISLLVAAGLGLAIPAGGLIAVNSSGPDSPAPHPVDVTSTPTTDDGRGGSNRAPEDDDDRSVPNPGSEDDDVENQGNDDLDSPDDNEHEEEDDERDDERDDGEPDEDEEEDEEEREEDSGDD